MTTITRPEIVEDEHLEFLDELRDSGITNMFGARSWLMKAFKLPSDEAQKVLLYWMKTFNAPDR